VKSHYRVIVIGGGIAGCSVLYHLAKLGWRDTVLLEKGVLTSGSTWHAAGLCTMFSNSLRLMKLLKYSIELYQRLEQETGHHVGFKRVGSLRLATNPDYVDWYHRISGIAHSLGIPIELISASTAVKLSPLLRDDGIICAAYMPDDGYVDPSSVTQALAKGARQFGAEIYENTQVKAINLQPSGEWRVITDQGSIAGDIVVNAAGQWAREIGKLVGVDLPIVAIEHQYAIMSGGVSVGSEFDEFPVTRDPEKSFYMRKEGQDLLVGFFEPNAKPWCYDKIPPNFNQQLLNPDFKQIEGTFSSAMNRVPLLETMGIKKIINGPDGYTPDGNCLMGEIPGLRNFYILAGFSCFGIVFSGGAGRYAAEWIVHGRPSDDMWELDVRRFGQYASHKTFLIDKACETYKKEYAIHFPYEERLAGRPTKTSYIYDHLRQQGAVYGARFGWERPLWFAPIGTEPSETYTFKHPDWFKHVGNECRAVREHVGLLDQTSFGKILVSGPGAAALLNRMCANRIPSKIGKIKVTQMLNENGGIEADVTITRLEEEVFLVITAAATTRHDLEWIRRFLPRDNVISIRDVTSMYGCLTLTGPNSREVLQLACLDDVSNDAFPFMTMKNLNIGYAPIIALRISYVGELGWELYHPIETQGSVYQIIDKIGRDFSLKHYGYRALDSLRMEKGYRLWGADMTGQDTPFEAGLNQFVSLEKGDFIGRDALLRQKEKGISRSLECLTVDNGQIIPHSWEPILYNDKFLGYVTSGEYGHCVDKSIFLAYLPIEFSRAGTQLMIEVLGERYPATVMDPPIYDHNNNKPRS
jgi:glycine cleavage system aminomethyltransferase T/glycine/D-amino acid oxidase-like deaminating enzyme